MRTWRRILLGLAASALVFLACQSVSSIERPPLQPSPEPIRTIAVAPASGAFGNAVAERLAKTGTGVTYTDGSRSLLSTLHLSDSTMLEQSTRAALHRQGISAVLTLVAWYQQPGDGKPDSVRVRVVSTLNGADVAGVDWTNGRGNAYSLEDDTMRSTPSAAALVIGDDLGKQLE